jgi:hypothetical protein
MSETRGQIKQTVELNVGRENQELENKLCDEALKVALVEHPFDDAVSQPSDFTITEDATSVSIAGTTDIITIVTARIVQASGDLNKVLKMKNRTWWDRRVINPEDNQKGWPEFGLHFGTSIILDRPAESNLELRLRVSTEQKFTTDSTACPIALLDTFVVTYVTAKYFKQLKQFNAAREWMNEAVGPDFYKAGNRRKVGGLLQSAIDSDKSNIAEEMTLLETTKAQGVAVENLITGHGDYGSIREWH